MSGNAFKKRAEKLMSMGLIAFSVGKVFRQKANYYFLTEKGEEVFNSKFGAVKKDEFNREKIERQVEMSIKTADLNFDCETERMKNFVIQRIAKYSSDNELNLAISVKAKNDKDFKKIEFKGSSVTSI